RYLSTGGRQQRLACKHPVRGQIDVVGQSERRVRNTLEAREAGYVHDIGLARALDDIEAIEIDSEHLTAAQRDVAQLPGDGEGLSELLLVAARRPHPKDS